MKFATRNFIENPPVYAVFNRRHNEFTAFVSATAQMLMNLPQHGYEWLPFSAYQTNRLGQLTDGDKHINATAKNLGLGKVRIYAH